MKFHFHSVLLVDYARGTFIGDTSAFAAVLYDFVRSSRSEEPNIYKKVKNAFVHFTGFNIEQNLYPYGELNFIMGGVSDAEAYYACIPSMVNDSAPRLGSVLAVDSFLILRPQEWGVSGPNTKGDFRNGFSIRTLSFNTMAVERAFNDRLESATPYLVIPYAAHALNLISQFLHLSEYVPSYMSTKYMHGFKMGFSNETKEYASYSFNNDLHIFEPCTIRTFDLSKNEVLAPMILPPVMTKDRALPLLCGILSGGFQLARNRRYSFPFPY